MNTNEWKDKGKFKITGSRLPALLGLYGQEKFTIRINKFFEVDFAIKVNSSNERRFDLSTVIFKFGVRIKLHV